MPTDVKIYLVTFNAVRHQNSIVFVKTLKVAQNTMSKMFSNEIHAGLQISDAS